MLMIMIELIMYNIECITNDIANSIATAVSQVEVGIILTLLMLFTAIGIVIVVIIIICV